jgi:hypothetical protein
MKQFLIDKSLLGKRNNVNHTNNGASKVLLGMFKIMLGYLL